MEDEIIDAVVAATREIQFENADAVLAAVRGRGIEIATYAPDGEFMGYTIQGGYYVYGPDGPPVFMGDDVADDLDAAFDELGVR